MAARVCMVSCDAMLFCCVAATQPFSGDSDRVIISTPDEKVGTATYTDCRRLSI